MTSPGRLPNRLERLIERAVKDERLDERRRHELVRDLRDHFEEGLAAGQTPQQLEAAFGDAAASSSRFGEVAAEDARQTEVIAGIPTRRPGAPRWRTLLELLTYSARNVRRSPAFSLAVVLTLALGMGANTAVFSVLDAVIMKPLPYEAPEQLVTVQETWEGNPPSHPYTRAPVNRAMREWTEVFSDVATIYTYRETGADLVTAEGASRLITSYVSAGYFEMLGASPVLGRTFDVGESYGPGERSEQEDRVAILSHHLWRRAFDANPNILDTAIELDGRLVRVVGVMRPALRNPMGTEPDLWVPQDLRAGGSNSWHNYYLNTIARVAPGLSLEAAAQIAETKVAAVREQQPESGDWGVLLTPLQSDVVGNARHKMLLILAAAAGLVLISACINVGNMVFARGIDREREIALHGALGSARARTLGVLVLENLWLAGAGGAVGLAIGLLGVRALMTAAPSALPASADAPGLSGVMFVITLLAAVVSLAIFGLAPAISLSRVPLARVLGSTSRGGTESSRLRLLRSVFVVAQVAAAVVLLVGTGLLLRSFQKIRDVALGISPQSAVTFEVHLPGVRYSDPNARTSFHDRFQERVAALPSVEAVGAVSWLPLKGRYHTWWIVPVGTAVQGAASESDGFPVDVRVMTGQYFEAAGIQLLRGDPPNEVDGNGQLQVWISNLLAEQTFPNRDPLGQRLFIAGEEREIAGVVSDVAVEARGEMVSTVYLPHRQFAADRNWPLTQVVRSRADVPTNHQFAEELRAIDPALVLFRPRPLDGFVDQARAQERFILLLMSVFAALAIGLVLVGCYGVLAGSVARRTQELGIRMALGADAATVRWSVMGSALRLVAVGIGIGGAGALAASRWLDSLLFEVASTDWITYSAAALLLLLIGCAASLIPARRATRVDPASSLG